MSLNWPAIRSLSAMTDDIGVLSIYTTADRHDDTGQPAWQARVRKQLRHLPEQVKAEGTREQWVAVKSRLDNLTAELDQLLDSRTSGLGRALFAPLTDADSAEVVSVQVPLTEDLSLAPMARLRPLVGAWTSNGPAGAVSVSVDEIRIIDLRLGTVAEVATIPHPDDTADRRNMKGPAHGNPTMAQQTGSQYDLFNKRAVDRLHRYLHTLGPQIAQTAAERGWDCLAITGDIALAQAVAQGLPRGFRPEVAVLPHPVSSMTAAKLANLVAPALQAARSERGRRLAASAHDAALAAKPGPGVLGLEATLDALQEGQVAHLLLARESDWSGLRGPDERLVSSNGSSPHGFMAEPHLDERMIELAMQDGADISVLDDEAAEALGPEGIGATLRWNA